MGSTLRPKSIRGKVILAFLATVGPLVCMQVSHEIWECISGEREAQRQTRILANAVGDELSTRLDRLLTAHRSAAQTLAAGDLSKTSAQQVCRRLDASEKDGLVSGLRTMAPAGIFLRPGSIGQTRITSVSSRDGPALEIATPIAALRGGSAVLASRLSGRALAFDLARLRGSLECGLCAVLDARGRVICSSGPAARLDPRASVGYAAMTGLPGADLRVEVAQRERSTFADWRLEFRWVFGSIFLAMGGLIAVYSLGNRLSRRVRAMQHAAHAMAVGDYRRRVKIVARDELSGLAESFNKLGESLMEMEASAGRQSEMLSGMVEAAHLASSSLDMEECGKAIARVLCTQLGARDATVFVTSTENGGLKVIGRSGRQHKAEWKRLARHVAVSGEYLVISEIGPAGQGAGHPREATLVGIALPASPNPESGVTNPAGAIVARFDAGTRRQDLQLGSPMADVLRAFGMHAAAAVKNAQVYLLAEKYSEALEGWVEHLTVIMHVTDRISPSLNLDETLVALAQATKSALDADDCTIYLPGRDGCLTIRACCNTLYSREQAAKVRILPGEGVSGLAFARKQHVVCPDALKQSDPKFKESAKTNGIRGVLSAPLIAQDTAIGVITIYTKEVHHFTPREVLLLTSIGLHAAVVIKNADRYTTQSSIAHVLQQGLVSEAPARCAGCGFACRYIASTDEARIGGDLYDVTALPNGKVGVLIADVSGKGLKAAIHLAACKYMMKAFMYAHPDYPGRVVRSINDAINYYAGMSYFVTLFYGVIDPVAKTITYANAGHPPPLLVTDGGMVHTHLSGRGIPVGSGYYCDYETRTIAFEPSDLLLLYTDGVIDTKIHGSLMDVEGLDEIVFEAGKCTASELIDHVCNRLSLETGSPARDDIALLAVSFEEIGAALESGMVGGTIGKESPIAVDNA